ncbi:MAG: hypothetical protein U9Q70_07315 [Chloroflexota bacterium]|nr:hypothetical protein [Chloroflexota bacterium]
MTAVTKAKPTRNLKGIPAIPRATLSVPQTSPTSLPLALARPDLASPGDILALQRTVGNRATTHLIQAQVRVGPAGDRYEREADQVAAQVMTMPAPTRRQIAQRQEEEEELQAQPLASTSPPLVQRQAERHANDAPVIHPASPQNIQRIFGRGRTTRKSRVYQGRPGGRQSQEKVIETINLSPQGRATQLKRYLVDKPVKGNLNGFNVVLPLLEGGSSNEVENHFPGNKTIPARLREIFSSYRQQYLLEVFQGGEPSAKSKFALRAGLLTGTSFTFGRGSGRREHNVNTDLVAFAHTLSVTNLRNILADRALIKPLTKKTLRLLKVELRAKQKEAETEDVDDDSERLVKQVELFNAYQKQLIEMVSSRPVKIVGSRSKHKRRLTNELQQWAEGKPRAIIDKLLNPQSEFSQTLASKYKRADVIYLKALMKNPSSWQAEHEDEEEVENLSKEESAVLQQIEALLARQTDKGRLKRLRQRGNIQAQIEKLLFGEGGPANALATVRKLYGEGWQETLGNKLQAAGLAESKTEELLTKIEHGGETAGGIYQQLWRRVPRESHAKLHRSTKRVRWSRTTLDLIQQLKPGTPAYNLVQGDHALLVKIEEHSKTAHWDKITAILGLEEVQPEEEVVAPLPPDTGKWVALLNAELTSNIINRATLYQHVFNAQQDAWTYGKAQLPQEARAGLGDLYENHGNVPEGMTNGYNTFMRQLGAGIEFGKWWSPGEKQSRTRLKQSVGIDAAPYARRLTVGDLLNAAKKSGGKRRTKQELVKFAIEGLSGQALLDQWAVLDRQNLVFKVKATLWGQTRDRNQKSLADLLKRPERVKLERALLERIAKECLQAERSKEEAADAMVAADMMTEDQRAPDAAIRYVAQRTLSIAGLEGAQQLSKGKQWSRFSTRSLIYKEAQSEYLGKLRSTHTDIRTGPEEEKEEKLTEGTQTLAETAKTLKSEEEAFKALRVKYNRRFKALVMTVTSALLGTLGLVFTGGLSAGPLMAGLWAALSSVISKGISTLVEYTNEGNVVVTDAFRELFVNTVIGFIGGVMGNVNLAVRSLGAKSLYGDSAKVGAKLFGKPGLSILGGWAQQLSTTVVGAPSHAVDRLLQSSSVTSAWQQSRDNFAQKFKGLPLGTLQSYAKGFLTMAVVEGSLALKLGDLLPKSDHPGLGKLGTGEEGLQSKETFEKHGAIRPFEFDSWKGFWKSIVQGSQVNTTDYGKSFIIYRKGVPKGWEVDTSVLTTDDGPQSLVNAYKSLGFTIVMGSLKKGVSKALSTVGPSKQPSLTGRKSGGTEHEGYEAFGELDTEKLQRLNTLNPEDRAKLMGLSTEKITALPVDKLLALARKNALRQAEFTKLNELSLPHLQRFTILSLTKLATRFSAEQLAAFKTQNLNFGRLGRFLQLPTTTLNKYAQLDAVKLARLVKKFSKAKLTALADLGTPRLEAVSQLNNACLRIIRELNRNQLQTLAQLSVNQIGELTAENIIEQLNQQD